MPISDNLRELALSGIERHAWWLKTSSREIVHYVKMLTHKPPWETMAEAAIKEAEEALIEAATNLDKAKALYADLKTEGECECQPP